MLNRIFSNSTVGAIKHSLTWLEGKSNDLIYANPHFDHACHEPIGIFCIHGTADSNASFKKLAKNLNAHLPADVAAMYLVAFESRFTGESIEHYAEQLLKKIQQYGFKSVILMGHSRGGLIAAYFAENLASGADIQVKAIFTICSPFEGSFLAKEPLTLLSASVSQMQVGSHFLHDLNIKTRQSSIPYYYFSASQDGIVHPEHCCPHDSQANLNLFKQEGHLSIMRSPILFDMIANYLDQITAHTDEPPLHAAYCVLEQLKSDCCQTDIDPEPINLTMDK